VCSYNLHCFGRGDMMTCRTETRLHTLVVDDSNDYLDALTNLLATFPCIGNVRRALSASEALAQIGEGDDEQPDLMLVDIAMPDMNGFELTRSVKARPHPPKVIIVTLYDTPAYREAAKAAGADGFLGKSDLGEGLLSAIQEIFPEYYGVANE
jgi:DNA-binding NarL/FixJ family response regulator